MASAKEIHINGVDFLAFSDGRIYYLKNDSYVLMGKRRPSRNGGGIYLATNVPCGNGKRLTILSHRIIALAFIPNPQNKRYVNHKDRNTWNNCVENLEWVTPRENSLHRYGYENYIQDNYA